MVTSSKAKASKKNLDGVYAHIDNNIERHITRVQEFLRQPSVASQDRGVRECAKLLLGHLESLGFKNLELVETTRHPVVCARYDAGSKTTLVIHGMYDTGAVPNEKDWVSPPFEARIVKMGNFGRCIVAPGALRKAPNITFLNALESILAVEKTLPINLVFNVEGEHSLMSPNYPEFYEKYKKKIPEANAVFWPMASQDENGHAEVKLGDKGMMGFQLECNGKEWGKGPIERAVHSADAGIVNNTTWRLMSALMTMVKRDGNEIAIDEFHDDVKAPSRETLELVDKLTKNFDEKALMNELKVNCFADDLHGKELLKKHLFSPVLCIGNLAGGSPRPAPYPSTKVEVHIRLVPEQTVDGILRKMRNHLDRRGYKEIRITPQYGVPWTRTDMSHPLVQATTLAYEQWDCKFEIWPNGTRTPPTGVYNLPYMDGGLGYGRTGVNEFMTVDKVGKIAGVAECEKYFVSLLYNYAELSRSGR